MDRITESLLKEYSSEHGLQNLPEYKRFEHFTAYVIVRGEYSESFDTHDVVVGDQAESSKGGSDTGIDGIGIIVNGFLIADLDELDEVSSGAS